MSCRLDEFAVEGGRSVDWKQLQTGFMPDGVYDQAHKGMAFACHDLYAVTEDERVLLVMRKGLPLINEPWPLGGRVGRGMKIEDSLRKKVMAEGNFEIQDIDFLGSSRTTFRTDPFGHGGGTDTFNFVYSARIVGGAAEVQLDNLHEEPMFYDYGRFARERDSLHPSVVKYMDQIFEKMTFDRLNDRSRIRPHVFLDGQLIRDPVDLAGRKQIFESVNLD